MNDVKSIPSSLKKEYQEQLNPEKIRSVRVLCSLGLFLYLVFMIVDLYALPSAISEALAIRMIVISIFFASFISTFSDNFIKYYKYIQLLPYIAAGIGINLMILLAEANDKAADNYFAGLILVIMVLFSWTHLKIIYVLICAIAIIGMYVSIELSKISTIEAVLSTLVPNCFFLVSAAIIGFTTQLIRDQYLRQNFLLQQSLKEAYDKKSEEARDNEYLANHDPLTDLPNRRYMTELLNKSLDLACEKSKVLVIMFIDLNGFKQINDVYGHNAGDEVLLIVAKRLELAVRQGDHLSRLGGDEFLMGLMMDKENLGEIEAMADKFVDVISQSMNVEGLRIKVGASVGVAAYPIHGNNIDTLINIADHRMYQVKQGKEKTSYDLDSMNLENEESVVIFPGNRKSSADKL